MKPQERSSDEGQGTEVLGLDVDYQSRCEHSASHLDIVAFRFKCCGNFYACVECHNALAGHKIELWDERDRDAQAVFCGICRNELTLGAYVASNNRCPGCGAAFGQEIDTSHVFAVQGRAD